MHKLPTDTIPKARLRVERPIKPLSNTAGETGLIISRVCKKNVTQVVWYVDWESEVQLMAGLQRTLDPFPHCLEAQLGIPLE